jgi:hypothetical protein
LRDEFIITRQNKQYVLFAGLLDAAHAQGLRGIATDLLQIPSPENGNVAIVKAIVDMGEGRTFSGIGDASPQNVGRNIAPHVIRMAETRAKARALRDALNVGAIPLDELGADVADETSSGRAGGGRGGGRQPRANSSRAPVRAVPDEPPQAPAEAAADGGSAQPSKGSRSGRSGSQKARKSQIDLLRTLAEELRGENGVARLEAAIGKTLDQLTRAEADEWIDRLTPSEEAGAARTTRPA